MEDEGLDSDADMPESDQDADDSDEDEDLAMEMEDNGRVKNDEMCLEHVATLERLRQNQRRDYLKVRTLSLHTYVATITNRFCTTW